MVNLLLQRPRLLLLALLFQAAVAAGEESERAVVDSADLAAFIDSLIGSNMAALHIPGAAVAVVRDSALLFSRGYGYARLDEERPVSAAGTTFYLGSVGKLFTTTAAMQLAEAGRLDLSADINAYLAPWQIPATYPEPIAMRHLLTHTAGLDESILGLLAPRPEQIVPLGQYARQRLPRRVMAPGALASYSNYGMALAGYIVELRAGMPYAQYVERHILDPLGMAHSGAELSPEIAASLATGYQYDANTTAHRAVPRVYLNAAPAGSIYATVEDVARFMSAHLQEGRDGDAVLLGPATTRTMQQRQFTHDERLPGIAYGFIERFENGQRILMHGGALQGYGSFVFLIPDQGLGLAFSCNTFSPEVGELFWEILGAFVDRYLPDQRPPLERLETSPAELARVAGHYQGTRYPRDSLLKMVALMGQVEVEATAEGALRIHTPVIPGDGVWHLVGPLLFAQEGSDETVAFRADAEGRISHLYLQNFAFERIPWYRSAAAQAGLLVFCLVLFLSAALAAPLAWGWRRWRRRPGHAGWARRTAALVSALHLAFVVGLVFNQDVLQLEIGFGVPPIIVVLLCLLLVGALLTVPLLPLSVAMWRRRDGALAARLHTALVVGAAVLFALFLYYWNLLGFSW